MTDLDPCDAQRVEDVEPADLLLEGQQVVVLGDEPLKRLEVRVTHSGRILRGSAPGLPPPEAVAAGPDRVPCLAAAAE